MIGLILFVMLVGVMGYESIYQQDIEVLTLRQGHMTTSRRTTPVPQLSCVGVLCNDVILPDVVQCYNKGVDDRERIQWKCEGKLQPGVYFKNLEVSCEGFENRDDPFVLVGSCGLEYTLRTSPLSQVPPNGPDVSAFVVLIVLIISLTIIYLVTICAESAQRPVRRNSYYYYDDGDYVYQRSRPRYRTYGGRRKRNVSSDDEELRKDTGYANTRNR